MNNPGNTPSGQAEVLRRVSSTPTRIASSTKRKRTMKTLQRIAAAALLAAMLSGCKAFHTLTDAKKDAQGRPYELIVVCPQQEWTGEMGDSLRSILTAPVPYLNQTEPLFDVLRVTESSYTGMIADHRNILRIVVDPSLEQAATGVEYDLTASPQIVLTLQGPDDRSIVDYLSANRDKLVQVLEKAERDRSIEANNKFYNTGIRDAVERIFGVDMKVPKGYVLAKQEEDFLWGPATNTPPPVRVSSSTPIPTKVPNRSRPRHSSPHATALRHAFPALRTART